MGLAIYKGSNCVWGSSYGGFSNYRKVIVEASGFNYNDDELDYAKVMGLWEENPSDPLAYILCHSDCEGWLFPHNAEELANALEQLLPKLGEWAESTEVLIGALREASEDREILVFA